MKSESHCSSEKKYETCIASATEDTSTFQYSKNVVIIFANLSSPAAKEFNNNTANLTALRSYLKQVSGKTNMKIRPVLVSKMDGK